MLENRLRKKTIERDEKLLEAYAPIKRLTLELAQTVREENAAYLAVHGNIMTQTVESRVILYEHTPTTTNVFVPQHEKVSEKALS